MKIKDLLKKLSDELLSSDMQTQNILFENISFDSRNVLPNSVFFAFRGESYDSHDDAISLYNKNIGIKFIISEKELPQNIPHASVKDGRAALSKAFSYYFGDPLKDYKSIAVTGTNGKTTTSYITDAIFRAAGLKTVRIGTTGAEIDGEFYNTDNTTPSSYEVFSMLKKGVDMGCSSLSIEISSHALSQHRLAGIKFDSAIFTNLTGDHLDFHKDMDSYFAAKRMLFEDKMSKYKIVNIGHEYGERLAKNIKHDLVTFAVDKKADIFTDKYESSVDGIVCEVNVFGKSIELKSHLIGEHNIENILGAFASASVLGISFEICAKGIADLTNVPGRLEKYNSNGVSVFVDYAHTDDALINVINALRQVAKAKIITVFGAGGDRDKTKRPRMAKAATGLSDIVVITSDNPRTEEPMTIINDIQKGVVKNSSEVFIEVDREKAIKLAISKASKNDIILIAGKGHEDYQIIGKTKHPFKDMDVVEKYL